MKLLVLIGTDVHLNQLPHFLAHYVGLGVDGFLCGLHGGHADEARALLAPYPHRIVADYGTERYDQRPHSHWVAHFNDFRRRFVESGEWCLYAAADEFHEYPAGFFADVAPQVNAVRGRWVERLATPDGQLLPCSPQRNIGQQYPYATRQIFCGIAQKIMAVRADLDLMDGYTKVTGGSAEPVYYPDSLNIHHFRWDDRAADKYRGISWTSHYDLTGGCVPALQDVFYVNPPFPAVGSASEPYVIAPKLSVVLPVRADEQEPGVAAQVRAAMDHIWVQSRMVALSGRDNAAWPWPGAGSSTAWRPTIAARPRPCNGSITNCKLG